MTEKIIEKGLDATNKTLDLTNKVYDDGLSKPVKTISNGLNLCLSFLGAIVSPKMYEYIQSAEYRKREIDKKLSQKYATIPEENRIDPRMKIMGPAVELLKYNLDEEHIKEIFINVMTSEMNSEKQDRVLPSYIDIARQLSKKDAQTLKSIYQLFNKNKNQQFILDIIRAKPKDTKVGYVDLDKYIIGYANKNGSVVSLHTIKLDSIVIDNLKRLEIIKIYEDKYIPDKDDYEIGFDSIKNQYSNLGDFEVFYEKGILEITDYGMNFLSICFE